ncbi:MAG: ribonuclease HI [Anaerolineae bacterium]|jgi:ribonuclease HI
MGDHVKVLSDKASSATANAMLIRGATEALQALNRPCRVAVYSDADYLIKGASQWATGWQARDWETRSGQPVANREAWEALLEAARAHQVTWIQARGEDAPDDLARAGELAAEAIAPEASAED